MAKPAKLPVVTHSQDTTDWQKILLICNEALGLDTAHRGEFLEKASAGDPKLRHDLYAVMDASVDADSTFDSVLTGLEQLLESLKPAPATGMADGQQVAAPEPACPTQFTSSPFASLATETLSSLLSVMEPREYAEGELLIRQGDSAEYLLLIISGTALARVRDMPGDRPPVGEFGPGDVVGEIALITEEPRTADVIARTPMRALRLPSAEFDRLALRHPDLRVVLTNVVADRLGWARHDGLGGKDIHGYRIVQCVGRGGMGVVYEAQRLATGNTVALKMMNHRLIYEPGALRRFRREASILKTLQHPSLAQLYEYFSAYKTEFLAMEFCHGTALNQVLAARRPIAEPIVRRMLGQLAQALSYVHSRGVIHRDLKPSNTIVNRDGTMKLIDFGIVKFDPASGIPRDADAELGSRPGAVVGTARYMAPEQFSGGAVDRRVDFYGLACIAFEALAGRPVVEAQEMLAALCEQAAFILPPRERIGDGISAEMHELLASGLAASPEKRTLDLDRIAAWAGPVELG